METTKLELTITLKPIHLPSAANNSAQTQADSWLENNDATLLKVYDSNLLSSVSSVDKTVQSIKNFQGECYNVETINLKQTTAGFDLETSSGKVSLQTGDVIQLPDGKFEVLISKKQLIVNPQLQKESSYTPASPLEDIWGLPTEQLHSQLDTVQSSSALNTPAFESSYHSVANDPLEFLYGSSSQMKVNTQTVIPQATGLGSLPSDSLTSLQSPMPSMSMQESDLLNVNTQNGFHPSMDIHRSLTGSTESIQQQISQGNILNDLGISEMSSSMANTHMEPISEQRPLTQQAPVDMLDEFLRDDTDYLEQSNSLGFSQPSQETSFLGKMKSLKNKITS